MFAREPMDRFWTWLREDCWRGLPAMGFLLLFYFLYTVFNPLDEPGAFVFVLFILFLAFSFSIPMVADRPEARRLANRVLFGSVLVALPLSGLVLEGLDATYSEDPWRAFGGFLLVWIATALVLAAPCSWMTITLAGSHAPVWRDWWRAVPPLIVVGYLTVAFVHPGLNTKMQEWFPTPRLFAWTFGILLVSTAAVPIVWGWPGARALFVRISKVVFVTSLLVAGVLLHFGPDAVSRPLPGLWMYLITSVPFWALALVIFVMVCGVGAAVAYATRWAVQTSTPWVRSGTRRACAAVHHRFNKG